MIESILKLLESYPVWAKAALLLFVGAVAAILIFGRVPPPSPPPPPPPPGPVFLRIKGINLYPPDPAANIRVQINVNGTEWLFPNIAGVEWMKVGPDMSQKIIRLPNAKSYHLQFKMVFRYSDIQASNDFPVEVEVSGPNAKKLPFEDSYKLYLTSGGTTTSNALAEIYYAVTQDGQ